MQVIAVYLRISLDRADQQVGIARQRADCLALAHDRWPTARLVEYVDNDISAYSSQPRPQYTAMLSAEPPPAVIVAWNLDRLLRQPRDLEKLIDLGIPVVTATGDLDLTTHDGQLQARILAAVAKKASDDTSRRVSRAARDRREQGRWHGGRYIPFGYRSLGHGQLVIEESEAAVVEHVARQVASGRGLTDALRDPQSQHGRAPRRREGWRQLLVGNTIVGRQRDGSPGNWAPIIDDDLAALLALRLATTPRTAPANHWPLSGVAFCGACGGRLYGQVTHGDKHYACRACWKVSVAAGPLETVIEAALDQAVLEVRVQPQRVQAVDDTRLAELAQLYVRGDITKVEWDAARAHTLSEGVQHLGREDRRVVRVDGSGNPGDRWSRLVVIDKILVSPARRRGGRFDPERVSIIWRA